MITPWVFEFFHAVHDPVGRADSARVQEQYRRYLELWEGDESRGFEGIFFSEHHFGPGYSPSPNLLIATMAPRTTTLRMGVLGTSTPYATPWRVAEEFAMLDHLTRGRLEMGVVSGIPPELARVGISREDAAARHTEVLDVLQAAIRKPVVSYAGPLFPFDELRLTPIFFQRSPAIWTASTSPASARRAGQRGLKVCSGFASAEKLVPLFEAYREGAEAAGLPAGPEQLAIRRQVSLVEHESETEDARRMAVRGVEVLMRVSREADRILDAGEVKIDPGELIYGTPEQVADEIIRQCQVTGVGNFLAGFNIYDPDLLTRTRDLFGLKVIPLLRAAQVAR